MFLTAEQVYSKVPSAGQINNDGKRSNRYVTVSTRQIVENMEKVGFLPTKVRAPKSKIESNREFGFHEINFRPANIPLVIKDRFNRPIFPEIKIGNSLNGTSSISALVGLFVQICTNGLTLNTSTIGKIRQPHTGFSADEAYELIQSFTGSVNKVIPEIDRFRGITLESSRNLEFANEAKQLRWPNSDLDPINLLQAHRAEDMGNDLWTVFNVVQENLMNGRFKVNSRTSRPINNIKKDNKLNSDLWALLEKYSLN